MTRTAHQVADYLTEVNTTRHDDGTDALSEAMATTLTWPEVDQEMTDEKCDGYDLILLTGERVEWSGRDNRYIVR